MAQPFDLAGRRTTGSRRVIAENITASPDPLHRSYSVADNGTLVYLQKAGALARQLTMYGVDGTRIGEIGDPAHFPGRCSFRRGTASRDSGVRCHRTPAVWVYDLATGVPTRLAFGSSRPGAVAWAPDRRWRL